MHELPVTESILDISLRHADEAGADQINNIYIVIGQLASIIDDSVQFYWDIVSKETIAEGAQLHFRRIKTILLCRKCQFQYSPEQYELSCPECEGREVEVISGKEFYVEAIDVEA
jgi:hydrogenase nickel incorporation protein HypA/HybF